MTTIARALLAAIMLAGATLAAAAPPSADPRTKPSSYAPRPRTNGNVYGSPIDPPIVGHGAAARHAHAHGKRPTSAATHHAHRAPAHAAVAQAHPQSPGPRSLH